jgi:hypothetical protein
VTTARGNVLMAAIRDLAKQIETLKIADSKALELKGRNVRGPSLIAGQLYLGKSWKVTVEGSDNVWMALRFVGSGRKDNERTLYEENPRLIDMKEGDYYFFEHFQEGKIGELNAYQSDDCLVYGDTPVRLTFFEIKDVTIQTKPEKSPAKQKTATVKKPRKSKKETVDPADSSLTESETESVVEADSVVETEAESDQVSDITNEDTSIAEENVETIENTSEEVHEQTEETITH